MWTIDKINNFLDKMDYTPKRINKEIKSLPNILRDDEELLGLINGVLRGVSNPGVGALIVTDKRIMFYRKSIIGTETKEEYPLNRVSSSSYRKGLLESKIMITTSGNNAVITNLDKKYAKEISSIINELIQKKDTHSPIVKDDITIELEKLFSLKEKGIITPDEFSEKKKQILGL